ncbi:MAG: class I tRNA ligase family protein [Candidatus Paceibacterota bacterium]|jgi:leucyl-tRNA synthetase|nr:class I tRNA ligase family protein [Candidatus Paceibacterota bacterium]
MTKEYDHKKIEQKWRREWEKHELYKTPASPEDHGKPKCYVLDMFPFPSGEGLHVGHPKGYIASDIYSRFKKMNGFNILHPMGWDAFGLPAEQYAIKNKIHPRIAVEKNIARFKEQLSLIGFNYDWDREINTTDTRYYKWTQWIFLKLLEKGLAYESFEPVNWCPSCQTGLANEDLDGTRCERCGTEVEKRPMRQWVLKITDYADRLIADLDDLNWPEHVKEAQRNWIGRSEGALISFQLIGFSFQLDVFTTRPDTLFGATYCVVAPEHELIDKLKSKISNWDEVLTYREDMKKKTEIERTAEGMEKTGVKLVGVTAINPVNNEKLPIFIADYVLAHYGTGAIMAVPAHDSRDHEFAKKFDLPIRAVIEPVTGEKRENEEFRKSIVAIVHNKKDDTFLSINWGDKLGGNLFVGGGRENDEDPLACAGREIGEETGYKNVSFISQTESIHHHYRAHSKGVNREIEAVGLYFELDDNEQIPIKREEDEKGKFTVEWIARSEVGNKIKDELHALAFDLLVNGSVYSGAGIMINSGKFDGMTNDEAKKDITEFAGGQLKTTYKLRDWVFSRQRYWGEPIPVIHCERCGTVPVPEKDLPVKLPDVDSYEPTGTGESPLANIRDWVNVKCPKCHGDAKRETNTMPNWAGSSWYYLRYIDPRNQNALVDKEKEKYWSPVDVYVGGDHATRHLIYARFWHKFLFDIGAVNYSEPFKRLEFLGVILAEDGRKMSKRWGNVVNPDDIVELYGADTLRVYEMFMGPFENASAWKTESIIGSRRFVEKIWRIFSKVKSENEKLKTTIQNEKLTTLYNQTLKKISENIEDFKFNTAISAMMILANELEKEESIDQEMFEGFLKIFAPFAPHIADELWHDMGHDSFIYNEPWPEYDALKIQDEMMIIAVQVNGKLRATFEIARGTEEEEVKKQALLIPEVLKWTDDKKMKKVIYVKEKLVSIVI